jgi:molecular chaperone GrpE
MIKEKQEAFDYANANLLSDLLSSLDDLDRALAAAADTKGADGVAALVEGVSLIQKQLRSMLENKYNLVGFGEKGDAYDHDKHEALASNPAPVKEPVCAEVYLKGYMLKDRILRPAKVMVHMPDGSVTE